MSWTSDEGWNTTKDSFIFSFTGDYGIESYVLSRVKVEEKAVNA